jgi:hypothetical protein
MTCRFIPLRRLSALSVAITLTAATVASAQSPDAAASSTVATNTGLLSPAAFVRLLQPLLPEVALSPGVKDPPRPGVVVALDVKAPPRVDLVHLAVATTMRDVPALKAAAPQKSWAARHKVLTGLLIGVGAFFGAVAICYAACEDN